MDYLGIHQNQHQFSSAQSLSYVWLFATSWTAALQASLSITNSQSLLKLMSIELVMPSYHLILCHPLLLLPQSFPGSFQMSQFFTSGGQGIRVSASKSVLSMNIQGWFPLGWTGWISLKSKGLSRVLYQHHTSKASILLCSAFFIVPLLIHTWLLEKP